MELNTRIAIIKKWFISLYTNVRFRKTIKRLTDNPKLMSETMDKFEKMFGKNANVRTKKQWKNLVNVYGIKKVCELESMTEKEVEYRCNASFKEQLEDNRIRKVV